jgi:hypothetical protein
MGEMRNTYRILSGEPEGKVYSEDLGLHGRIILKRIIWKYDGRILLAQDRGGWLAFVDTINILVS